MHLKKTKKTPRMFRMIALMLSLVLVFFTMTGMALAEEGTDVSDAAPDSTLEIVETELEVEPEPTEEPPAETPGAEETPEPTPEPEEPSIPPETTDAPALEPDYELDAEIPTGWHNAPVTITVRLIDKNNTGWVKIEAAFSNEDDAERFDVTEEWNEYGYLERTMPDNGTVYFYITDPMGVEHELPLDVFCMDFEAPVIRAGINGTLLRVEASDALSGIAAVFVNDELYTTLENGELNVRIDNLTDNAYLYIDALDNAGNETSDASKALPPVDEGQTFTVHSAAVKEGKTTPPKHYTEDTLLSAMEVAGAKEMPEDAERKGLGTPATRAAILEKLVATGFVERKKSKKTVSLIPTHAGIYLITVLPEQLQSPLMTAEWEHRLKEIERGEEAPETFMQGIRDMVCELVKTYKTVLGADVLFPSGRAVVGKCPRCGSDVTESKKGYFCERNDCHFGLWRDNRFLAAKKINLTKKMAETLLKDGKTYASGIFSEKTGKTYDAYIVLEDDGQRSAYKLEFSKESRK